MIGSLILFILFVIVYILISDVITIIFRLTGTGKEGLTAYGQNS